uniref:SFRICE_011200 n=1 Tax=Spodoptera frugiperda TaxID=7108 RepID=A0A2H1V726_SPOFR
MPCGKRPLVKNWDKPRRLKVVTPSRYEQTLDSVKVHWQNVIKELEMSYKDEQFWETNCDTVRELVGPVIFQRIAKVFDLPEEATQYTPTDQFITPAKSEDFYVKKMAWKTGLTTIGEGEPSVEEEEEHEALAGSDWTESTVDHSEDRRTGAQTSKSIHVSKSLSKMLSKSFSRFMSKISNEFFDWWVSLGNVEFKSEIKRPEDIEALFQVWFDQHASRGLVLDPKIMPCVLTSIATNTGVPKASCLKALKRQIADDIQAETSPAHTMAFGKSLPHKLKHLPPQNNTAKLWRGVIIPEDLRTMSCVWGDIQHLT